MSQRCRLSVAITAPLLALLLAAAPAAPSPSPAAAGGHPPPAPSKPYATRPMIQEMLRALETGRATLGTLQGRYAQATDEAAALALQREIERVKRETEIALLSIQASHARREGRVELARELENAIAVLRAPPTRRAPQAGRPAPEPPPASR